jgi:hypothetical protein
MTEDRDRTGSSQNAPERWPFDQGPNAAALTVSSILAGQPILYVSHDADDHGWQFLDGRPPDVDEARVISMAEALRLDGTLRQVADLPPGWVAWRRGPLEPWSRGPHR